MALNNKTSADLVAILTLEDVAPSGIQLSQFSTDAAIQAEAIQEVQAEMTVDAEMVYGYTPNPIPVTITLQPTSPAIPYIREFMQAQRTAKAPLEVGLTVSLPSTGKTYTYSGGALTQGQAMPPVNRVLDPISLQFTFGSVK